MLRLLFAAIITLWAGSVSAQQLITIDPNNAEYRPGLVALRGCGFSIGKDPSWSHEVLNRNGKREHVFVGHPKPVGAFGRLIDEFYGNTIHLTVYCEEAAPSSDKGQTAYNKTLADSMRSSYLGANSLSSVSRASYGPFRNGYQFSWSDKSSDGPRGVAVAINGNVFAHVGDTRVTIFYRVVGHNGEGGLPRHKAGTVLELSRSVHAKLTAPVSYMPSGAMMAIRTLAMEKQYIAKVLSTIQ